MPISIPNSIGGISIPSLFNGPLSKLYKNPYQSFAFSYPRNLGGDPTRKHVIEFVTRVPDPSFSPTGKLTGDVVSFVTDNANTAIKATGQIATGQFSEAGKTLSGIVPGLENAAGQAFQSLTAADVVRKDGTTIRLYVPDTVNVSYTAGYDDISLAGILGKPYFLAQAGVSLFDKYRNSSGQFDVSKIVNAVGDDPYVRSLIGEFIAGNPGSQLLTAAVGQALNPQMQVIFSGIGFRSFQFDFTLTPYSEEEAQAIRNIVFHFKLAAAPTVQSASIFGQGLFYKVPDRFKIKFLYNGLENQNVHRMAECVLENINVDYAPIGWATFGDGNPVQTKLTLQFKEVEIIDKTRITEGY